MECRQWPELTEQNVPYYIQIHNIIFRLIQSGELKPGDQLPGENILASKWRVSRGTVRLAIRKLMEDGYISKTQGKHTTVAAHTVQTENGLQRMFNPCLENCTERLTRIESSLQHQQCGWHVARELGYPDPYFSVVTVSLRYFVRETQVADSICLLHIERAKELGLDGGGEAAAREFALRGVYAIARRALTKINIMTEREGSIEIPGASAVIVMEENLVGDDDSVIAYCKYNLHSEWYRFFINRKNI